MNDVVRLRSRSRFSLLNAIDEIETLSLVYYQSFIFDNY